MSKIILLTLLYYFLLTGIICNIAFVVLKIKDKRKPSERVETFSYGPNETAIVDGDYTYLFSCGVHLLTMIYSGKHLRYIDQFQPLLADEIECFNLHDTLNNPEVLTETFTQPVRYHVKEASNCYTIVFKTGTSN